MAITYGILGQTADASTEQTLYIAPPGSDIKVKVTVTNRVATTATFRVALVPNGGITGNEDYIAYDKLLLPNATLTSVTFTINASDEVRAEASTSTVSFTAYGIEQT